MKKILIIALTYIVITAVALVIIIDTGSKMYLLNWGEYMDPQLIEEFEEKYNVSVVMDEVGSSEEMYQKISSGTTKYDLAIPGDYVIEKLYKDNLIDTIDFSLLENYEENMFNDDLEILRSEFFEGNQSVSIPYFWGAYAIIYSEKKAGVKEAVEENGFDVFFNKGALPSGTKVGMYDIARWLCTCYLLNNGMDVNTTDFDTDGLADKISKAAKSQGYTMWANDALKKSIAEGNLDVAFVQLGDFFDQYYITVDSDADVTFGCYIPDYTAAFYDGLVIPKNAAHKDLAHKFIDFFLDTDVAFENACYVGYSPTIKSVIQTIEEDEEFDEMLELYPFYTNPMADKTGSLFRDLGTAYSTRVEKIYNAAK